MSLSRFALMTGTIALACQAAVGCSQKEQTYSVAGMVTLDGKPLENVTVVFDLLSSDVTGKRYSARASTDSQGKYQLATFRPADGAVPGRYRVIIVPNLVFGDVTPAIQAEAAKKPTIPARYLDFSTTPLEYEIKPTENQIDLVLHIR